MGVTADSAQASNAADDAFMRIALTAADAAAAAGEVPVGAVLVHDGRVLATGRNRQIETADPTAHAEVLALRAAGARRGNHRLPGSTLYCTIEPCTMCIGAIVHARVGRLVFGAPEPKAGAVALLGERPFNHRPDVTAGCLEADCGRRLSEFFRSRRAAGRNGQ